MMVAQSKQQSMLEAWANGLVGVVISWVCTVTLLPFMGVVLTWTQALEVTLFFIVVSTLRSYVIRRIFNCWA